MSHAFDTRAPAAADAYFAGRGGKLALWTGVLGGPVAWALQFQAGYAISRFTCTRHWLSAAHHAATLGMLLGALACTLLALREWRRAGGGGTDGPEGGEAGGVAGRSHFLAALGVLSSGLFSLVILAEWVPVFFLSPCWY